MKKRTVFACVIGSALLVRCFFLIVFWGQAPVIIDEQHYNAISVNLVETGTYAFHPGKPTSIRPPLYPFFLATVYQLTGINSYNAIRIIQIFFTFVTAWILYLLCRRVTGEKETWLSVGIFLFYPSLVIYNFFILSEILFNLFFVASIFFIYLALSENKTWHFLCTGIFIGLASLTRSITYPMMPLLAFYLFFTASGKIVPRLKNITIMLFFFTLVLSPWVVRNYDLYGQFIPVDTMGGLNLYMGNYEYTPMHRPWSAVEVSGEKAWYAGKEAILRSMNEAQKQKWCIRKSVEFIISHPALTVQRSIIKVANFWGIERSIIAGISGQRSDTIEALTPPLIKYPLIASIVVFYASVMLFGVFGLIWKNLKEPDKFNLAITGIILYFTAMHALVFGHSRYHLPLVPLLAIYGVYGVTTIRTYWFNKQRQIINLFGAVVLTFSAIWAYEIFIGSRSQMVKLLVITN
ncbi:ArnT family glycosyltransferase [Desulfobulbus propionicus]